MSVEVAVIPAAGRGTRMRPATRVVPKALLTVVDRPAIQFIVEEAARAGATEVILVVDHDTGHLVEQHFSVDGGLDTLAAVRIRSVVQEEPLGLGHAVAQAAGLVGDRSFFCLLSDNIVRPGGDVLGEMGDASGGGEVSVMCLRELSDDMLSKYGVVVPASEELGGVLDLAGAVEKPGPEHAPSRLGLVGRYVFTSELFAILEQTEPGVGGEIQLTDAIHQLGLNGSLRGYVARGDLLDMGTPAGLVEATAVLGADLR